MCRLHANLAQWEQAIEWRSKSPAANPRVWAAFMSLAAANAWAAHMKEAKEAAAQLQKLYPGFTVQTLLSWHWTDDPTFNAQYQRLPRACARRACRRARRGRIEPAPTVSGVRVARSRVCTQLNRVICRDSSPYGGLDSWRTIFG
jgi:hypothetical protein